jgi:hypothetical protein
LQAPQPSLSNSRSSAPARNIWRATGETTSLRVRGPSTSPANRDLDLHLRPCVETNGGDTGLPSAADDIAIVDGPANQRPSASADNRAERFRSAGSDNVAEHAAAYAADDQAGGAVVASAVVAVVRTPIDAIISPQPSRTITAIIASVLPRRIPVPVARVIAIFTAVPLILTTIPPIFPAISPVLAPIPPVFATIPALVVVSLRRRWLQADKRCQEQCGGCCSDSVHLDLPCDGHD